MYCDYNEEHIDPEDCYGCDSPCKKNQTVAEKGEEREKELERLRGSELAVAIKTSLTTSLNIEEGQVDTLIINLFDGAFKRAENTFRTRLYELAEVQALAYIDRKAEHELDAIFQKALGEKLLLIGKDEKSQTTKIQAIIADRITGYLAKKDSYNNRGNIEKTVDKAIAKVVDGKVKDALTELTEETINKFNKEAMKKMMTAMVGAIQHDKRLMAVMTGE